MYENADIFFSIKLQQPGKNSLCFVCKMYNVYLASFKCREKLMNLCTFFCDYFENLKSNLARGLCL